MLQTIPLAAGPAVQAAPTAKGSSSWVKIAIVAVVIIFVGGAIAVAGVIYVAHKVSQKAQEYKREVLGESPSPTVAGTPGAAVGAGGVQPEAASVGDKTPTITGDLCNLLSKEDVGAAIGVVIVQTTPVDGGCSYLAKGTENQMAARHAAAMTRAKGADKKTQGLFEQFAGVVAESTPKTATDLETADGNAVVFNFSVDTNNAEEQMRLNAKFLGLGAIGGINPIEDIGDEAFSKADSMMMVRKGDKLIRIMYMSCPCTTDAVKPLAKKLADGL